MSYIFLQRPAIDTDIDTIVNAEGLSFFGGIGAE